MHAPRDTMMSSTVRAALGGLLVALIAACKQPPAPSEQQPGAQAPPAASAPQITAAKVGTDRKLPTVAPQGNLETVALFDGPMPTGVTVSQTGRVFVSFPRWGDKVDFTVAEVKNGNSVPFPTAEFNQVPTGKLDAGFVSVQSVVVDPLDRLWAVDTGSIRMGPTELGGPKLVGIDLGTNTVTKTIVLPRNVALPTTYLNDVRFDMKRGKGGMAFVTDSSASGPNGIIVVDLDSGRSWRKLHDHPSTKPEKGFLPIVEGRAMMVHEPGKPARPMAIGSDGIAISQDGKLLYYSPLASRRLYAVSVDALASENMPEAQVAKTVQDLGEKGASDGLESDAEGRVYATNYEQQAVLRRKPDGTFETLVEDPRALWPDTLSLASDGYLYFTANQLERQPQFNDGRDVRQKPYSLFRVKVDGTRLLLK